VTSLLRNKVILNARKSELKNNVKMTKGCKIFEKVEVLNATTSKPPQWDGKDGDIYLM
jgi:hypothetical protein